MLPLLHSSSLRSLVFPRIRRIDSCVFDSVVSNSSLREISFEYMNLISEDLAKVAKSNSVLNKLDILECGFSFSFSPLFNSIEANSSLMELDIRLSMKPLNGRELLSLLKMLELNSTLVVLILHGALFESLKGVLDVLKVNSVLKKVTFPSLKLGCLIDILEANLPSSIISYPPSLNQF
ncbi:hypothetical protein GEMRC1_007468 [Eukaryota sp. GEM-RC1]